MITLKDYYGVWELHADVTKTVTGNALDMLNRVNALLTDYQASGGVLPTNPKTKTFVSGETGGGFRPQSFPIGASKSSHKTGQGVDIYDPKDNLKNWLMRHQHVLIARNLYMEDPRFTDTWCHLQSRPTRNRVFMP